ncbi:hypothetical protein ACIBTV_27765 [Micromonospora sp. NPDC049366]|uniref:hypothetical protein n=1 Tax=Micromonospora sp. NPDC049366 TaxID=3364271 RepID=UPI00378EAF48
MTYQTPAPLPAGPDPADDPRGYLEDLLVRYFRPGLVDSLARTWVPVGIGSALAWVNANYDIVIPADASSTVVTVATGVTIAGYYAGARLLERRFPRVGRWLLALNLTKARPTYAQPKAAEQVEAAAARTPARHS